jgi:2'-5' RNA ligase
MALRLFVALALPSEATLALATVERKLRRAAGEAEVKWAAPENAHLTLQFLGSVAEERLAEVSAAVQGAARTSRALSLSIAGAGGFPNAKRPRVLWAGVEGDREPLAALVAELGARLAPLGFPPETRPFAAHLTLGRTRDPRGARDLEGAILAAAKGEPCSFRVAELTLFRSHLSPRGARYEPLAVFPLGPGG